MKQLLIATHNPAKVTELKEGLIRAMGQTISLLTLDDLHITADPEETGATFAENAKLKADYFANLSGLPTIADDGGIEIDALGGQPGVHSKRWLGRDATDAELIAHTIYRLKDVSLAKRTARFTVCLHYCDAQKRTEKSVVESVHGHIASKPSGLARKGFPYRALFIVDAYNTYYDEMTKAQHLAINHRLQAISKLAPFILHDLIK